MAVKIFLCMLFSSLLIAEDFNIQELTNFKAPESFVKGRIGVVDSNEKKEVLDWISDKRYFEPAVLGISNIALVEGTIKSFFVSYVFSRDSINYVNGIVCSKIGERQGNLYPYKCKKSMKQLD